MRYAISNWIYGDEPLGDQFKRLATFGYDGIELVGEPGRYAQPEIKKLCGEFGISVSSVLGWSIWGIPGRDGASQDEVERAKALDYCQKCVDMAHDLEAPILVVIPAPAGRTAPKAGSGFEEEWQRCYQLEWNLAVDSMQKLARYASGKGVTIGLEPINRYETFLVTNVDQALRFIDEVDAGNVKLHLDAFHMNIDEADIAGAVRQAGNLLVNMHISDSNREAPGRGHFDFEGLMKALKEISYLGYLTLEPVPPGSDPLLTTRMSKNFGLRDAYAKEGIEYLKKVEKRL